MTAWKSIK